MDIQRTSRNTLADAFRRSVRNHGNRLALSYVTTDAGERRWTFAELDAGVQRIAASLLASGLKPGDRVAAYGRNSDSYVMTFLACVRVGLIHVPINYALVEEELVYILSQSGASAVFADPTLVANIEAVKDRCQVSIYGTLYGGVDNDLLMAAQGEGYPALQDMEMVVGDCVQLMYTSGTTSRPKGAIMTHECLWAQYQSCIIHLDIKTTDTQLAALPLYHTAQMHVLVMPYLLMGAQTVLIDAPLPELCFSLIEAYKITAFFAPPTVWIGMLRHADFDKRDLSSLQKLYYGASIMPEPIVHELMGRLPQAGLYNCYGQTELSPLATVLGPADHQTRPASAGKPVLNVETRIVDEQMEDVAVGERGEIVHRSPHLMRGYWDKPDETAEAFAGGWFHSGDLGVMDVEGFLYIVDRVKDVINTGGVLVASREVEEALYLHPAVAEVAVIGVDDPKWIEAIAAVVVLKEGGLKEGQTMTEEALLAHAREHLAPFKLPKQVFFRTSLPKNASGKVLKRELREQLA